MANLLDETLEVMKRNHKVPEDVNFIRCKLDNWAQDDGYAEYEYYMTWDDFAEQANKIYDNGYGGTEIKDNLQIVGKDWWLERHEYDGSEWWEFKSLPTQPKEYNKFSPFKYEEDEQ